jgi:hypothetical protein
MIARLVLALVVFVAVGLGLVFLLGPIILAAFGGVPVAAIIGQFFVTWGWGLAVLAGLWFFFSGWAPAGGWPWRRP